jgi:hypothetical protein
LLVFESELFEKRLLKEEVFDSEVDVHGVDLRLVMLLARVEEGVEGIEITSY